VLFSKFNYWNNREGERERERERERVRANGNIASSKEKRNRTRSSFTAKLRKPDLDTSTAERIMYRPNFTTAI